MGKTLIESVNRFLRQEEGGKALEAFRKELSSSLAYMFTGMPQFVRDSAVTFFSKLVAIDDEFLLVMGPRRETAGGRFEHPTYHIGFDNKNGRFFAAFTLKFVRGKYVTLVYPSPDDHYFDEDLGRLGYKVKHQSNGDYATVWIGEEMGDSEYELMARAAYRVRCHYLRMPPSKLKQIAVTAKPLDVQRADYLPTKADCEMAIEAIKNTGRHPSISKEQVFDWLERDFQRREIEPKSNWKVITERNLEIWFG